jgi:hypothetical protein
VELPGVPRDWRRFDTLALEVFVADVGMALGVRIDDRVSGPGSPRRFETAIPLAPGWSRPSIDTAAIGKAIDLSDVLRIVLYAANGDDGAPRAPREFIVGAAWLEPTPPEARRQ